AGGELGAGEGNGLPVRLARAVGGDCQRRLVDRQRVHLAARVLAAVRGGDREGERSGSGRGASQGPVAGQGQAAGGCSGRDGEDVRAAGAAGVFRRREGLAVSGAIGPIRGRSGAEDGLLHLGGADVNGGAADAGEAALVGGQAGGDQVVIAG